MAKARQTFRKKELEDKKKKKQKEKNEKKEARKANGKSGSSLEDMMAYVDEYGRISSTPPDPTKKKEIILSEDIQLGVPKQLPPDPADLIHTGTVTFFNTSKGYGFIKDAVTQESIFVHVNSLKSPIAENDKVSFEVEKGPRGLNAVAVSKV